jgi:hypothetical protein
MRSLVWLPKVLPSETLLPGNRHCPFTFTKPHVTRNHVGYALPANTESERLRDRLFRPVLHPQKRVVQDECYDGVRVFRPTRDHNTTAPVEMSMHKTRWLEGDRQHIGDVGPIEERYEDTSSSHFAL